MWPCIFSKKDARTYHIKLEYIFIMEASNTLESKRVEEEIPAEVTPTENSPEDQESTEPQVSMQALLDEEGLDINFPRTGETRTGVIASISNSEILVSVGAKSEGILSGRELDQIDSEIRAEFKVGQDIPVYILSTEDKNGHDRHRHPDADRRGRNLRQRREARGMRRRVHQDTNRRVARGRRG